jgi:putative polyhydroxyalkanoate system protein
MAHIKVDHPHSLGREEAKDKVLELIPQVLEKITMDTRWSGDTLYIEGSGVKGTIDVLERKIAVRLSTSLMLRPFRSQITSELKKQLSLRF